MPAQERRPHVQSGSAAKASATATSSELVTCQGLKPRLSGAGRGADTFGEPVDLVRAVTRGLARATAGGRACRRAPGTGAPSCARACTGPAPTLHCIRRTALPGSQTPRSPTTGRRMSTALRIRRHKRLHPQALLPADGRARHTEGNLEGARLEPSERITQLQNTTPPSPGLLRRTFVLIGPSMYSRCDPV